MLCDSLCCAEQAAPCPGLCTLLCGVVLSLQKAKEDVRHATKKAAINAETAADSTKHEAKGFGARLWGKGQVRHAHLAVHMSNCAGSAG